MTQHLRMDWSMFGLPSDECDSWMWFCGAFLIGVSPDTLWSSRASACLYWFTEVA